MSRQLEGKVALVTGAGSGIGRAVAERFIAEGACVVGFNRSAAELKGPESSYVMVRGDVRSSSDLARAVRVALDRFGRLDILVPNAGIYDNRRPFKTYTPDELEVAFHELFSVNVKGYMLSALAAADALTESRGCIIFTGSISGSNAGFGGPLYVASKHAVNGLTKQLALELAPHVRVNAVAPGYVPTGLKGLVTLGQDASSGGPAPEQMLLGVIGQPEDYAGAYVFLASQAASRIATGTVLALDGGSAIRGPR